MEFASNISAPIPNDMRGVLVLVGGVAVVVQLIVIDRWGERVVCMEVVRLLGGVS